MASTLCTDVGYFVIRARQAGHEGRHDADYLSVMCRPGGEALLSQVAPALFGVTHVPEL